MMPPNPDVPAPSPLTMMIVCDACEGVGLVAGSSALIRCPSCDGTRERPFTVDPRNPWGVLRALRDRPLVHATTTDDPVDGGDAVDELAAIRALLDVVLDVAPTLH